MSSRSRIVNFSTAARSPWSTWSTVLKGSAVFNSGFFATSAGTFSRQYMTWVYSGCSTHSVPSWSKVAIRSSGGTNFGLPCWVVS